MSEVGDLPVSRQQVIVLLNMHIMPDVSNE
jgi:hypothetical protein